MGMVCDAFFAARATGVDKATTKHLLDVGHVERVAALNFGEGLRVKIVVKNTERSLSGDERAALLPAGEFGNKVRGTGQFYIQLEGFF
jgi:hypothetical protein